MRVNREAIQVAYGVAHEINSVQTDRPRCSCLPCLFHHRVYFFGRTVESIRHHNNDRGH